MLLERYKSSLGPMKEQLADLFNTTYRSRRDNINGFMFYDSVKQKWCEVLSSTLVFATKENSFGITTIDNFHRIEKVRYCSAVMSAHMESCSQEAFNYLRA